MNHKTHSVYSDLRCSVNTDAKKTQYNTLDMCLLKWLDTLWFWKKLHTRIGGKHHWPFEGEHLKSKSKWIATLCIQRTERIR